MRIQGTQAEENGPLPESAALEWTSTHRIDAFRVSRASNFDATPAAPFRGRRDRQREFSRTPLPLRTHAWRPESIRPTPSGCTRPRDATGRSPTVPLGGRSLFEADLLNRQMPPPSPSRSPFHLALPPARLPGTPEATGATRSGMRMRCSSLGPSDTKRRARTFSRFVSLRVTILDTFRLH
jgi:hypothetical protein